MLDNIVASVDFHIILQHLLHSVSAPAPSPRVCPHVDVVPVEMSPVEELLHWTPQHAGQPTHLGRRKSLLRFFMYLITSQRSHMYQMGFCCVGWDCSVMRTNISTICRTVMLETRGETD